MPEQRPDPDELLEHVQAEEASAHRGRLRIFFGATAGVGKTYAMLEAARAARANGTDIVIGYVEPHGRIETERLMEGLEQVPTLAVRYRDIVRQEFNLDAALARHPAILIVDELAHSNLAGGDPAPRHPKRWQDIEELLEAGIDVWTTVNVQHLESLNDVVAQITGVRQRETLPDRIFDEAHEVELIDLPPDDLLARLRAGKIYQPQDAGTATDRFFRRPNLLALRELALRRMTERVEVASRASLRAGRQVARLAGARPRAGRDRPRSAVRADDSLRQAHRGCAQCRMDRGLRRDAGAAAAFGEGARPARRAAAAGGVAGRGDGDARWPLRGRCAARIRDHAAVHARRASARRSGAAGVRWLRPSAATELALRARDFDVITIAARGAADSTAPAAGRTHAADPLEPVRRGARDHGGMHAASRSSMYPYLELSNLVMVYLLGVTATGLRFGRGPSVLAAVLNVAAFDFFFVPPRYTFAVGDAQYLVTFGVMLTIALVIATLMANVRQQTRVAGARERRTALLYRMSRELAATRGTSDMARIAVKHVAEVFQCEAVLLLPDRAGKLRAPREPPVEGSYRGSDLAVAQWVLDHGRRAGFGSDTLPAAPALYLPLGDSRRLLGVLAVLPHNRRLVLLPEQLHLLETFAGQIGLALERETLSSQAEAARVASQSESLRNTLLASISHDLRTPLAVMAGAGSTLARARGGAR